MAAPFWAQDTVTEPDPLPVGGSTRSHPLPEAVHDPPWHPRGDPVTVTISDPAVGPGLAEDGVMEKLVHTGGVVPPWVTTKAFPATIAASDRDDVVGFSSQDTVTEPDPLPVGGSTRSHPLPEAVHDPARHPRGDPVTVTTSDPAVGPGLAEDGAMEKLVQTGGVVPLWVTAKAFPATIAASDRDDVVGFSSQDPVTEPDPFPVGGSTRSHPLPEAVHDPPWHPCGDPVTVST
jgi:hypothetical protein